MSSVTVRIVLVVVLLMAQVPALASLRRLPEPDSCMPYRIAVLIFLLTTTLAATALVGIGRSQCLRPLPTGAECGVVSRLPWDYRSECCGAVSIEVLCPSTD